jgi:hypothetical protein
VSLNSRIIQARLSMGPPVNSVGAATISQRRTWFRFGFAAIELAHDIGANAPERLLVGLGFLAFAVCAFVRRANESALDEHVRTAIKTNIADSLNVVIHVERRPGRIYISEVPLINRYDPHSIFHEVWQQN